MYKIPCSRCNGTGNIPHHANVLGGVCFKCSGSGGTETKQSPEARQKAAEKKEAKKAADRAEMERRVIEANARREALITSYQNDPRIPATYYNYPAVLYEAVQYLDKVNNQGIPYRPLAPRNDLAF